MPQIRWGAALAAGVALVASGPLAAGARPTPAGADAGARSLRARMAPHAVPLSVRLHVSTTDARQLVGITLTAQPSRAGSYAYYFQYGDGVIEADSQPIASHGYREPGTYRARVAIAAPDGRSAVSAPVTIHVRYGLAPVVAILTPRPGETLRLRPAGARIAGIARDPTGIRAVEVAIQLVSSRVRYDTRGRCIWYARSARLVLSPCQLPHFIDVAHRRGRWSLRIPPGASIPAGIYVVRVRAIDNAGNISSAYAVRLRTIIPFRLAR